MKKKALFILTIFISTTFMINASTRSNVKIIEASENIRYLSQKIAKEYLYLYYNPNKINLKVNISENMKNLKRNIQQIEVNTQNDDSKNIINFLIYTNEEIETLLNQKISKDKSILILDYSETFVEAVNSIQSLHQYDFSNEEKMIMNLKELEYLLERVNKYYIASILNLNKTTNEKHLKNALTRVEKILEIIKKYTYPKKIQKYKIKTLDFWETNKNFLNIDNKISMPNMLLLFTKNFENSIKKLELYHKQNQ